MPGSSVWPILHYDDTRTALRQLVHVFGFRQLVAAMRPGTSALYMVTDDVDAVHERVARSGGRIVEAPRRTRFGSGAEAYVFIAADHEGNLWTFGSYGGDRR